MQNPTRSLEDLRREIDEIDDAIHDLIMRRAGLMNHIASAKANSTNGDGGAYLRPGREALVLRRLVGRHRGLFPKPALVRLWRELISAPLSIQGAFTVAVYAPEGHAAYWDLARDHYGSYTSFAGYATANQVIAALGEGSAIVGVLPLIQPEGAEPWWQLLIRADDKGPRIIARLPFAGAGNARDGEAEALVIGSVAPEPTGRDRSYVALEAEGEVSRAKLIAGLNRADLEAMTFASWQPPVGKNRLYLFEAVGFVTKEDTRLARFADTMDGQIARVYTLGAYAVPFSAAELA